MMKALSGLLASVLFFGGITENASFVMAADNVNVAEESVSENQIEGDITEYVLDGETEDDAQISVQEEEIAGVAASSSEWDDFQRSSDDKYTIVGLSDSGRKKEELVIPAAATKIAEKAFAGKSQVLKKVTFASGSKLTSIGEKAFEDLDTLATVELPSSLTIIGKEAFSNTGLEAVTIPANVTTIGESAFENNFMLSELKFEAKSKLVAIPEKMVYCHAGNNVLTNIVLPENITVIGEKAFYGLKALKGITIPEKVTAIKSGAFANSGITTVSVNAISMGACDEGIFKGCLISKVDFGNNTTVIPEKLFYNAGFNDVVIKVPANVVTVKKAAFKQEDPVAAASGIKEIQFLGNKLTTIEDEAFYGTNISAIAFPSSLVSIGNSAFEECRSLSKVALPEGVKSIGEYSFKNCKSLYSVYFPKTLTKIAIKTFKEDKKEVKELPFEGCPSGLKFYVVANTYGHSFVRSCSAYSEDDHRSFKRNGFEFVLAYSINYKLGKNAVNNVSNPTAYIDNETIVLSSPVRNGYNFTYWTKGKTIYRPDESGITRIECTKGAVTLKANWVIADDYTITYEFDGGTLTKEPKTSYNIGKTVTLKKPKKFGYTFDGWYLGDTKVTKLKKGTYYGGNIVLKAKWSPAKYTIIFDGNGATSGTMDDFVCTYGKKETLPANKFKKEGYTFVGWKYKIYNSKDYGYEMDEATVTDIRPKGTVKFIAQWEQN